MHHSDFNFGAAPFAATLICDGATAARAPAGSAGSLSTLTPDAVAVRP